MPLICHITTAAAWQEAREKGFYASPSLAAEGFIHCCEEEQVSGVLERYFSDKKDLLKLVIDTVLLKSPFIYEWSSSSSDTFPHIYGPVNPEAVVEVMKL